MEILFKEQAFLIAEREYEEKKLLKEFKKIETVKYKKNYLFRRRSGKSQNYL